MDNITELFFPIAQLQDNWDNQGSPAFDTDTIVRAMTFLRLYSQNVQFPLPTIVPSVIGSIDFYWQTAYTELLINVPQLPKPITFFGTTRQIGNKIPYQIIQGCLNDTEYGLYDTWIFYWINTYTK